MYLGMYSNPCKHSHIWRYRQKNSWCIYPQDIINPYWSPKFSFFKFGWSFLCFCVIVWIFTLVDHPQTLKLCLWDTVAYCCIIRARRNIWSRVICCSCCALFKMPAISLGRMRALPALWHSIYGDTKKCFNMWHGIFGVPDYKTHLERRALQVLYLGYKLLVTKEIINVKTRRCQDALSQKVLSRVMYIGGAFLIKQLVSKQR